MTWSERNCPSIETAARLFEPVLIATLPHPTVLYMDLKLIVSYIDSDYCRYVNYHVRLGEGYLVAPPLLLNLTGPFKAARPVITRWRKGAVQCLHVAVMTGDWRRATLCWTRSISNSVAASVLYSKQRCVYALLKNPTHPP